MFTLLWMFLVLFLNLVLLLTSKHLIEIFCGLGLLGWNWNQRYELDKKISHFFTQVCCYASSCVEKLYFEYFEVVIDVAKIFRHEPPVMAYDVSVLQNELDVLTVCKPASVPVSQL